MFTGNKQTALRSKISELKKNTKATDLARASRNYEDKQEKIIEEENSFSHDSIFGDDEDILFPHRETYLDMSLKE